LKKLPEGGPPSDGGGSSASRLEASWRPVKNGPAIEAAADPRTAAAIVLQVPERALRRGKWVLPMVLVAGWWKDSFRDSSPAGTRSFLTGRHDPASTVGIRVRTRAGVGSRGAGHCSISATSRAPLCLTIYRIRAKEVLVCCRRARSVLDGRWIWRNLLAPRRRALAGRAFPHPRLARRCWSGGRGGREFATIADVYEVAGRAQSLQFFTDGLGGSFLQCRFSTSR